MPTWLDSYSFAVARMFADQLHDFVDAREAMASMTLCALQATELGSSSAEARRFEADLHAFFARDFENVRYAFRLHPAFGRSLVDLKPSSGDRRAFARHLMEFDYTYIDCPTGSVPLGGGVEVKAIFVKGGKLINARRPTSVQFINHLVYDVVLGRVDFASRQRITWNGDLSSFDVAQEADDKVHFAEIMRPLELLALAGRTSDEVARSVFNVVVGAIAYASKHRGLKLIALMPKIPAGDRALMRERPHPLMTIFDVFSLVQSQNAYSKTT